jgi:flagellar protein FliJ
MREFRFRLQSILDVRRYEEDQRRMELGAISSRCAALRREIEKRKVMRREALTVIQPEIRLEDVGYRSVQAAYAARLSVEAARLEKELRKAEEQRLEAVERYRVARRNADVLNRLKEHRADAFRRVQTREEYKRMDEIAMSRRKHHGSTIQ